LSGGRPKFRDGVHPLVLSQNLVVLDTWTGIELLEGHLSSAIVHLLKVETVSAEMIAQAEASLDTLDGAFELDALRRRALIDVAPTDGHELFTVETVDYLDPQLAEVNRRALRDGTPWMLSRPRGSVVWVGPVFVPGRGPCWECMATRMRDVRAAWQLPESRNDDAPVTELGRELAALEAARWKREPHTRARLLTFDMRTLVQQEHVVMPRPDCAACGDRAARAFRPLALKSRKKSFTLDGGHRAAPPEQTYARYAHLVSPLVGLVQEVRRADGDSGALMTFVARHNYLLGSRSKPPSSSYGKGMTVEQARTGALCEALERYSGLYSGNEPVVRAAFRDLGEEAVHPHDCLLYSEEQYRTRDEWNATVPRFLQVPERFDEQAETAWSPAWSLTHSRQRYVATAYCYYNSRRARANDFAYTDSNGSAAGTCLEDAILQGLLELIERDAAGIWWYARAKRPAVALETPFVKAMMHEHAAHGRELRLLDLTTDLGIPVCAAVAAPGSDPQTFTIGFGAHLDPAVAVTRAITETNQMLALGRPHRRMYRGRLTDASFLEAHGEREISTVAMPSDDLRGDVLACVEVLARHGLETMVVDQTREEVGLPVVKVIVPGLRHFRPRFAPGRLFDVPVRMGWVTRPLRVEELNPAHLTV
jgi:ribosomal protein S12 methylthiotransferase accessory factor